MKKIINLSSKWLFIIILVNAISIFYETNNFLQTIVKDVDAIIVMGKNINQELKPNLRILLANTEILHNNKSSPDVLWAKIIFSLILFVVFLVTKDIKKRTFKINQLFSNGLINKKLLINFVMKWLVIILLINAISVTYSINTRSKNCLDYIEKLKLNKNYEKNHLIFLRVNCKLSNIQEFIQKYENLWINILTIKILIAFILFSIYVFTKDKKMKEID